MREYVSLSAEELPDALHYMDAKIGNGVILSPCNRMEIYFAAEPGLSRRAHAVDLFRGVTSTSHAGIDRHNDRSVASAAVTMARALLSDIAVGRDLFGLETNGAGPMNPAGGKDACERGRLPVSQR
jgi:hypothetical protein